MSAPLTMPTAQTQSDGEGLSLRRQGDPLNGARNPGQAPAEAGDATAGAEDGVVGSVSGESNEYSQALRSDSRTTQAGAKGTCPDPAAGAGARVHRDGSPEANSDSSCRGGSGASPDPSPLTLPAARPVSGAETRLALSESTRLRETASPERAPAGSVGGAHCDRCGRPSAGIMCEPCLRYELVRPGRLLAYTSSEVDELAEAAEAAARFWTGIAAWLRTEAARRAE